MKQTKFTQGPWTIYPEEVDKPYIRIRGTQLGGRFKIANVVTPVYEGVHEREAQETRANARLIAKAPERVLEAAVKGMLPRNPLGRDMYRKLKVYAGTNHPHTAQQPQELKI